MSLYFQKLNVDALLENIQHFSSLEGNFRDTLDAILLFLLKVLSLSENSDFKPDQLKVLSKVAGQSGSLVNAQAAAITLHKMLKLESQVRKKKSFIS